MWQLGNMLYKKFVATFCIFNSDVSVWLNFVFFSFDFGEESEN